MPVANLLQILHRRAIKHLEHVDEWLHPKQIMCSPRLPMESSHIVLRDVRHSGAGLKDSPTDHPETNQVSLASGHCS